MWGGGAREAVHALRNVGNRSLLDLQIKPAKADRTVGINRRKCLRLSPHLSEAPSSSAPWLLFIPERKKKGMKTSKNASLMHKHKTAPNTLGFCTPTVQGSALACPPSCGGG